MSFRDGFEAVDKIKSAGLQLSEIVAKVEALEDRLAEMRRVQSETDALLVQARTTISALEKAAHGLSSDYEKLERLALCLPAMVEEIVQKNMNAISAELEARLTDRLRDELKDTRTTLRDAFENHASTQASKLDEVRTEIISEMPRTLFGRRGR
jgi:chromosome segregation ATPase